MIKLKEATEGMSEFIGPDSATAIATAEKNGMLVVFPSEYELQIDIDTKEDAAIFEHLIKIVVQHIGVTSVLFTPSKSGMPKQHGTIVLEQPVSNLLRIALQACLGSDRKRELLSIIQELKGDPHPTLFLERKP